MTMEVWNDRYTIHHWPTALKKFYSSAEVLGETGMCAHCYVLRYCHLALAVHSLSLSLYV